MKTFHRPWAVRYAILLSLLLTMSGWVRAYSPNPNLTAAGAIAALKIDSNASPNYGETYNLGSTGLRGWIYIDRNNVGQQGLITNQSRQILVSIVGVGSPADGVLNIDDVILGAMASSTGNVPLFTGDCRKAFGAAIGDAEKTGAGFLRVKRWRAGVTTDVNLSMTIMGNYTATAPYSCPKSSLILAHARDYLVGRVLADSSFLQNNVSGAVSGLALMASVMPEHPDYAAVQTRLASLAHTMAPGNLTLNSCDTWNWGYTGIFLSEYYLRSVADGSPDDSVLHGINEYTVKLAKAQSLYGTYGHGGSVLKADGSLHGSIPWYGPVNAAGIPANIAIVMGKKALLAGGQTLDAEIDPAIERGSKFFAYFVNKGSIPYGEHEPYSDGHASNGKDAMCAMLFGLQDNRPTETEYFSRISTAGCTGREYGHTGQGFSYLWGALGANMGGPAAAAAYLNNVRWHLDLERRTDGSFVYDGGEQYGAGTTTDGTYLGSSSLYAGMIPTAWYILTYSLPLQRLYLTGKDANPTHILDAGKVAKAIAAATYKQDCTDPIAYPVSRLMNDLGEYDPAVRAYAAVELGARSLTSTEIASLITMAEGPDANARMGACESLGIMKTTSALPALGRRLDSALEPDMWVRGKAAKALKNYGSAASPQLTPMLTAFSANATDPNVIVWSDPIQIGNGYLADTLFQTLGSQTIAANKSLLYPAVAAGLKQPDGMARMYLGNFIKSRLSYADVQALAPSLVAAVAERSPADQMFSDAIRYDGLNTLAKYKIEEGIPLCLMVKEQTWHGDDWSPFEILRNSYGTAAKEVLPTLYDWQGHLPQFDADGSIPNTRYDNIKANIASTIAALEAATPAPVLNYFKTVSIVSTTPINSNSVQLSAAASDLDGGVPRYIWSRVSGPGTVSFSTNGTTASSTTVATFDTPGTHVLRVEVADSSILYSGIWNKTNLGYFNFHTYEHNYGLAQSSEKSVIITPGSNWPPVAYAQDVVTGIDTARAVTLVGFDFDGDPLSYSTVTPPAHGTLSGTAPNLSYTPTPGYAGSDSFTFMVTDSKGASSAVTTVSMAVQDPLSIHVNFDTATRTGLVGPAGGLGKTWNQPRALSATALKDSDGLVTGVSFVNTCDGIDPWSGSLSMLVGGARSFGWSTPRNLVISGLAPGNKYNLYIGSFYTNENGSTGIFTTTNVTSNGQIQNNNNGGGHGNSSTWVQGTNYVRFENVEPDAFNKIAIQAVGVGGNRAVWSGFQLVALPPVPPTAPTGLSATPGDAQVELNWDAVAGATSYLVKRASSPGGPYSTRANPATTGFLDAPSANGATWYYVISAVDAYGEGLDSAEVSTTPVEVLAPAAPTGLTASAGDGLVKLQWNASPLAVSYKVMRGTTPSGPYATIATPATTSYQDTSLLNGMTWYYVVTAVNRAGESVSSAEISALPQPVTLVLNVNIDSVTRTGLVGPAGGLGSVWNQIGKSGSMSQATNLSDTAGSPSGMGYQVQTLGNTDNWGAPGGLTMLANSVYNGSWGKITGLHAGSSYHLYIASYYNNEQGSKGDFVTSNATSNGSTQSVDNGWPAISTYNYNSATWVKGENYVVFHDIVAGGNGEINWTMSAATGSGRNPKLMFSGFQLEKIGSESLSPFRIWAAGPAQGLTIGGNDGPLEDPDADGIGNLLEFVLGGDPQVASRSILPTVRSTGSGWVFEYDHRGLSTPPATTQVVQYGSDLLGWTDVPIPATSDGSVTITPGSPSDHVSVALPDLGTTGFARLRVSE